MSIQEAINEVRTAIVGSTAFDVAVAQAAKDYDLHPELVKRKFFERYRSVEAVMQAAAHESDRPRRVQMALQKAAEKYGLQHQKYVGLEVEINGGKYIYATTLISRNRRYRYVMLDSASLEVSIWVDIGEALETAFREAVASSERDFLGRPVPDPQS